VIFCRKEYGEVPKGSSVIDVGANIGVFTIYALWSGSKSVVSVEPNLESFEVLRQNIAINGLESLVTLVNRAIAHKVGETIFIPRSSSPYNKVEEFSGDNDSQQPVHTTSLREIFQNGDIPNLDLLKMDCEGAEYDVLFNLESEIYKKITAIKMEHHNGKLKSKLTQHLLDNSLALTHEKYMILWFNRITG
ncbi:MAG: FkbM family methyltransferase, partial [Imperialibacter sp.]